MTARVVGGGSARQGRTILKDPAVPNGSKLVRLIRLRARGAPRHTGRGGCGASPAPRCSSRRRRAPCSGRCGRAGRPPSGRGGREGARRAAARPPRPARRWGPCPAAPRRAARSASSTCGAPGRAASSRRGAGLSARSSPPGRLPAAAGDQSPGRTGPRHRPHLRGSRSPAAPETLSAPRLRPPPPPATRAAPPPEGMRAAMWGWAAVAAAAQRDAAALPGSAAQERLHPMTLSPRPAPLTGAGLSGNNESPDWSPFPRQGRGSAEATCLPIGQV